MFIHYHAPADSTAPAPKYRKGASRRAFRIWHPNKLLRKHAHKLAAEEDKFIHYPLPDAALPSAPNATTGETPNDKPLQAFQTLPSQLLPVRWASSDRWHIDRVVAVPGPTPARGTTIPFAPGYGPCTAGVALTELLLANRDIALRGGTEGLDPYLAPLVPGGKMPRTCGQLVITWPDYPQTQFIDVLLLMRKMPRMHDMQYEIRSRFGQFVAAAFKRFVAKCENEPYVLPPGRTRGWRLGKGGIAFDQLRLLEVFSVDGREFHARMGVVPPKPGTVVAEDAILLPG
ncbi:hypothetical protein C8R46DRAFT_1031554 [Mycena filopes]|nr:hypothetical protein C8R46DRAFT_1031554 [Mycena filopes]